MKGLKTVKVSILIVTFLLFTLLPSVAAIAEKVSFEFSTCWWLEPGRKEWWTSVVERFEKKYPNITVKPVPIPYREYNDKMKILFAAGRAPDFLFMMNRTLRLWQSMGWLEPLDKYIDFDELLPELAAPDAQLLAQIDGQMYGVFAEFCPYAGLIYNRKIFQDAGLTVPTNPRDFLNTAEKLTRAPEMYGFISANRPANPSYLMQHAMITVHGFGGRILKAGKFALTDSDFIEGVEYYKKLYDSGIMPREMDYTTQRKMFWNGKAAMCMDGGYFVPWAQGANPEIGKQLDVAPLPFRSKLNPADLTLFGIWSKSSPEKKEAAVKFLKFYMTPEIQAEWIRMCGYPVTMKAAVTPEFRKEMPWFRIYEEGAAFGIEMTIPGYELQTGEIRKVISDHIGEVLLADVPAEQAMSKAQIEIEKLVGLR